MFVTAVVMYRNLIASTSRRPTVRLIRAPNTKIPAFDFVFALPALKWIAKKKWKRETSECSDISANGHVYTCWTNIHLATKLLIDVLFDDWGKGIADLFYIFRFFLLSKKYGWKYCRFFSQSFHMYVSEFPSSKVQSVSMQFKRYFLCIFFSLIRFPFNRNRFVINCWLLTYVWTFARKYIECSKL